MPKLHLDKDENMDKGRITEEDKKSAKDSGTGKKKGSLDGHTKTEEVRKKPAIIAGEGTSLTVKFHERAKPAPKPSFLKDRRKVASEFI